MSSTYLNNHFQARTLYADHNGVIRVSDYGNAVCEQVAESEAICVVRRDKIYRLVGHCVSRWDCL
jgi:hypothetical protein